MRTSLTTYRPTLMAAVPGRHFSTPCATRVPKEHPGIRFCACQTLKAAGDKTAIPALRGALRDPYSREDGGCIRIPGDDGLVYPVRIAASHALIALGEDAAEVMALARRK